MTEDEFRHAMIGHMTKQTDFLEGISDGMQAVRLFGKIVKWVSGVVSTMAGIFGLWSFLTRH